MDVMDRLRFKYFNFFALGVFFFASMQLLAMDRLPSYFKKKPREVVQVVQADVDKKIKEIQGSLKENEWFVYNPKTAEGFITSIQTIKQSGALSSMFADMGIVEGGKGVFPLPEKFSGDAIILVLKTLAQYAVNPQDCLANTPAVLKSQPLEFLIAMINLCQFLDIPESLMKIFITEVQNRLMNPGHNENCELMEGLNNDLQKILLTANMKEVVGCLQATIIERGRSEGNVTSLQISSGISSEKFPILSPDCSKLMFQPNAQEKLWQLWDIGGMGQGKHKMLYEIKNRYFRAMAFNPSGDLFVLSSSERVSDSKGFSWDDGEEVNYFEVCDSKTGKQVGSWSPSDSFIVDAVAFGSDNKTIALQARGWGVGLMDRKTKKITILNKVKLVFDYKPVVVLNQDCSKIAIGENNLNVLIVSTQKVSPDFVVSYYNPGNKYVVKGNRLILFSPDGAMLLLVANFSAVFDSETGKLIRPIEKADINENILSAAFSPDSQNILFGTDKSLYLCDVQTGKIVETFTYHKFPVLAAGFSPDGSSIVSCDQSGLVVKNILFSKSQLIKLNDFQKCTIGQAMLLRKICLNVSLSTQDQTVLKGLPKNIRKAVEVLLPKPDKKK